MHTRHETQTRALEPIENRLHSAEFSSNNNSIKNNKNRCHSANDIQIRLGSLRGSQEATHSTGRRLSEGLWRLRRKTLSVDCGEAVVTRAHPLRFYILGMFSLICTMQCLMWGTWGSILDSALYAFPTWSDGTITLLNAWAPIAIFVMIWPATWLGTNLGLRAAVITAIACTAAGALLRCIPADERAFTILAHTGAFLNGVNGAITVALPPAVAATWFPPSERTTATAVAMLFNQLGNSVMYLEPLLVRAPPEDWTRAVEPVDFTEDLQLNKYTAATSYLDRPDFSEATFWMKSVQSNSSPLKVLKALKVDMSPNNAARIQQQVSPTPEEVRSDIDNLMYTHAGIACFLLLVVVCYFPAKPPLPPSITSSMERVPYLKSMKLILGNGQVLLMMVVFVFSYGIPVVWVGIMNFSLRCLGIGQNTSMYIAIVAITASSASAFASSRTTDLLNGRLKIASIVLLLASSVCFLWYLLMCVDVLPVTLGQVYASLAGGVALQYATAPLLVELTVELAYPCHEGVVGAFLCVTFNLVGGVFLFLYWIPTECYLWSTALLVACTSLTVIPLAFVKEEYHRSNMDQE